MASVYSRSNGGGALPAAASPGGGPMSRKSRNRSRSSNRGPANANANANANSRSSRTRRRTSRHRNNNTNEESPFEFIGAAFLITSAIFALFYYCGVGLGSWLNNYNSGNRAIHSDYDSDSSALSLAIDSTSLGKIDDDEPSHSSSSYRNNNNNLNNEAAASTRRKEWAQQGLPILPQKGIYQPPLLSPHTSSIDTVVQYLTQLAEQPPSQLWNMFGMDQQSDNDNTDTNTNNYGEDPFSLKQLEHGKCPIIPSSSSSTTFTIPWLPSKPYNSEEIAAKYKSNMEALLFQQQQQQESGGNSGGGLGESIRKNKQKRGMKRVETMETYNVEKEVAIWYEHLSKAGGSTFCGLANANMKQWQVPRYHCMPKKGELMDGRVGSWSNEELVEHLVDHQHAIVSNEWDSFSIDKLQLSSRQLNGQQPSLIREETMKKKQQQLELRINNPRIRPQKQQQAMGPQLLFLTTLRDPCDRLLSAYTFFALTTTGKGEEGNGPTFIQWIDNNLKRAAKFNYGGGASSSSSSSSRGPRAGFRANTARYNHIVWRFSGGKLTHVPKPTIEYWKEPFEIAIQALAQHDLILPMDGMTKDGLGKTALQNLLGWDRFEAKGRGLGGDKKIGHVVTQGQVKNSNARQYFSQDEYRALWMANWLDNILYLWCRAVFLARLHCKDVL